MSVSLLASNVRTAAAIAALAAMAIVNDAHATFPGENGVIVFENPLTHEIGKVAPDQGATVTYVKFGSSPSVSPSGKKIAYISNDNVHVMNIDGSNDVTLTTMVTGDAAVAVAWRADGRIEFDIQRSQPGRFVQQMYSVNPDGTSARLTAPPTVINSGIAASTFETLAAHPFADMGAFSWIYLPSNGGAGDSYFNYAVKYNWGTITDSVAGNSQSFAPEGLSVTYVKFTPFTSSGVAYERNILYPFNERQLPANGATYGTNAISPDGLQLAAGVETVLQTRPRAGGNPTLQWAERASNVDWSRVPKNCVATDTQGGSVPSPGGSGNSEFYSPQCAIVRMPDEGAVGGSVMQAVAIGPDGRVYHSARSASTGIWADWALVPGVNGSTSGVSASKVAIAGSKDGSSQVVIVGLDNSVDHTVRNADGTWQAQGFQPVMNGSQTFAARDVAITINASSSTSPGNAQVIASGLNVGGVYHTVRFATGSWSPWGLVPATANLDTKKLAIAAGEDGNTYVLATVASGSTATINRQVRYSNSTWDSQFVPVTLRNSSVPSTSEIALTLTAAGTAQLLYTDSSGAWLQERSAPLYESGWTSAVTNTSIAPSSVRTVSISAAPTGTGASTVLLSSTSAQ